MKTIKCAFCGTVVSLTRDGKRPNQHRNGIKTCVGSGQRVETHEQLRRPDPLNPKPRKK